MKSKYRIYLYNNHNELAKSFPFESKWAATLKAKDALKHFDVDCCYIVDMSTGEIVEEMHQ